MNIFVCFILALCFIGILILLMLFCNWLEDKFDILEGILFHLCLLLLVITIFLYIISNNIK